MDCPPDALEIGMPVEVLFEAVADHVTLPKFRCLGAYRWIALAMPQASRYAADHVETERHSWD